jgi:hypothetical protein
MVAPWHFVGHVALIYHVVTENTKPLATYLVRSTKGETRSQLS